MAGGEQSSQEKTEDATPRRMREARNKGQVAKSKDLSTVFILIAAFGSLLPLYKFIGDRIMNVMKQAFYIAGQAEIDNRDLFHHIHTAAYMYVEAMAPYLAIVLFAAIFIGFAQVGAVMSMEPIQMQAKRLNIVENLKNMAKITTLIELLKNVAKLFVVFSVAILVVKNRIPAILQSMTASPLHVGSVALDVLINFFIWIFVCFLAIAFLDLAVQRWNHKKQLRMSKDEVKREYKQDEGDPIIKSARRQLHQELAMGGDTKSAVGASDVVITNPTHVAVAVKYDDKKMIAPQIMAKGQRLYAQMIREVAEEKGIPIMRNVPLAWALLDLEIGDEVPENLYQAVAEILLIVYQMRDSGSAEN